MKAILLVGGHGTRLRPLTFTRGKPTIDFCNKPILMYLLEALQKVGCDEVILAVSFREDGMEKTLTKYADKLGMKIHFSVEETPLGTAGPIALAHQNGLLSKDDGSFFMFNADVICEYPLQQALDYHKSKGGEGTILVTQVKDPSRFGVILSDINGRITNFVEKPKEFVGDRINAGIYVLESSIIDRIPLKPTSIERVIFPQIAADNKLFAFDMDGIWKDMGQRGDYLVATQMFLELMAKKGQLKRTKDIVCQTKGNVLIDPTALVQEGCTLGPDVVIGPDCVVEMGTTIRNSVVLSGTRVGQGCVLIDSVIGWGSKVGKSVITKNAFIGEDVTIADSVNVQDTHVCPHLSIKEETKALSVML